MIQLIVSPEAVPPGPCENRSPAPETSGQPQAVELPHPPPEPEALNSEPAPIQQSIHSSARYPDPSPQLIADIRKRLAELPPDVAQYVDEALRRESIEHVANFMWKAGHPVLMSSELYEYRRTLFPPGAILDPYTAGPPVLRQDSAPAPTHATDATDVTHVTDATAAPHTSEPSIHSAIHSPVPSPGVALLSDLRDVMNRYVVLPEMAAEALALWVVHTYAFTLRHVTTYIGVVSPEKRCGKTTLLELLGLLANRALTAANISPSALFRVIEETQPTLLIDEADTFLQGRDELAGILNAGYRKGNAYVVRVADGKARKRREHAPAPEFAEWAAQDQTCGNPESQTFNPEPAGLARYSCWCPKVMAAIGRLPDTLADRCVVITMQRKMPGEKCERMRQLNAADFRKRCAEFVRDNSHKIATAQPDIPSNLNDRAADIWEPLFAIADLAGSEWPELARQAAEKLSASDDDLTLVGYFLKDLRNLMIVRNVDRMLSRDVISALNPMHDRPWEDLRRGREINEWWLGWQLRQLGIRTKTMRVGHAMGKGYSLADIEGAFRRYVPNADLHLTQPTFTEQLSGSLALPEHEETRVEAQFQNLMKQLLAGLPAAPSDSQPSTPHVPTK